MNFSLENLATKRLSISLTGESSAPARGNTRPSTSHFSCVQPVCLHGPPKESKFCRSESLKGLQPYIRAICAGDAAAHDGYSRSGLLSTSRTQGTGIRSECPQPGLTLAPSRCFLQALLQNCLNGHPRGRRFKVKRIMHPCSLAPVDAT